MRRDSLRTINKLMKLRQEATNQLTTIQRLIDYAEALTDGHMVSKKIYDTLLENNVKFKFDTVHLQYGIVNHMCRTDLLPKYFKNL